MCPHIMIKLQLETKKCRVGNINEQMEMMNEKQTKLSPLELRTEDVPYYLAMHHLYTGGLLVRIWETLGNSIILE